MFTSDSGGVWGEHDRTRVLHVDDDPTFLELTADWLEKETDRLVVRTEADPYDALDALGSTPVECVVSDYEMPGMKGLELLDEVRDRAPDLPFILFTGKGSEEIASDAISAGVTDYLQKKSEPEQYELLANRIRNAVERYRRAKQHERVHEALDTVTEGIAILDANARFVYVNRAFAILYGYDPTAILGERLERCYPSEEATRLREEIIPSLDLSGVWQGQSRGLRTDDATFPQLLSLTELDDGGYVCVVRDITDRVKRERELERERNRARALFKNMAEPIAYYEFEGNAPIAREVNEAFEEAFGVTEASATGRSLDDLLVPEEYKDEGEGINERVRAGEIVDTEVKRQAADGVRTFDLLSVPLEPGESGERGFTIYRDR